MKLIEKLVNKYRKQSYKINSETTVLITGACSGIGKQLALNFAENFKCRLVIYDILDQIPTPLSKILKLMVLNNYYNINLKTTNYKNLVPASIIINVMFRNLKK